MSKLLLRVVSVLSYAVAAYAVVVYTAWPPGAAVHPELRPSFAAQPAGLLYAHVFAAAVALVVGPFQFSPRLRARWPVLHRALGRVYLGLGVLVGGVSGALLAWQAYGGPWARAGFLCLALAWLASGAAALLAIRRGDVAAHRRWMLRNFGLSLAAVSLRLGLPPLVAGGVPLAVAYPLMAWMCWLPQMAFIEWLLAGRAGRALPWRQVTATLALVAVGGLLLGAGPRQAAHPPAGGEFSLGLTQWTPAAPQRSQGVVIDGAPAQGRAAEPPGAAVVAVRWAGARDGPRAPQCEEGDS